MLSTTFSQSLLDEDCSPGGDNISRSPSLSFLGGIGRHSSFTTQADIDSNPIFYTVIKPVLDGKEPNRIFSDTQWNEIEYQHDSTSQSNDHSRSLQEPSKRSGPAARARTPFLYRRQSNDHSRSLQEPWERSKTPARARIPFLYRPPEDGSYSGSVSSLATDSSFYQQGCLDSVPEREESEDMEDHTEYEWHGSDNEESEDMEDHTKYEWHGSDNAHHEIGDDSTAIISAMSRSRTVNPSVSREQRFSSASSLGDYQASQSGYDTESLGGGYKSRYTTPTPSHFSSYRETYPHNFSRSKSPSSASAFGGSQSSQSGYDTEPVDEPSACNYECRDTTPTLSRPTGTMPPFPYASLSAPVRAGSVPAPVTCPLRYNTRSGQIPGTYVAKTGGPRRKRAGGESISATPYTRKDKKGH